MTSLKAKAAPTLIRKFQDDPDFFVRQVLGHHHWSKQTDILRSIRENRKVAVRSCHGTGKTFTAGDAALWFLYSFPNSRVVTTATVWPQVRDLLWHEINQTFSHSRAALGGTCLQTRLTLPDGRYAIGLANKPGQEESFAGHHAEHLLLIFDEASGIEQSIYDVGEGYMTSEGAHWLLIGNPTRPGGEFYSAFHGKRDEYDTHHISAFDTPAFTGEPCPPEVLRKLVSERWVEEREKWKGTALWDIRVMGNFPKQGSNSVIALGDVEAAQQRELALRGDAPEVIACDVARYGDDETVIVHRKGDWARIVEAYQGAPLTETAGRIIQLARERVRAWPGRDKERPRIVVDDAGVGGGVTDIVRERGWEVQAFNGAERARDPDEFPNKRSEAWFVASDQIGAMDLDADEQLAADLVSPTYKVDSSARRVVESKDNTKQRLGRSPDKGDALVLACQPEDRTVIEVW